MTTKARFKEADLSRAVRGVMKAGLKVERVVIDLDGTIIIIPEPRDPPPPERWSDDDV